MTKISQISLLKRPNIYVISKRQKINFINDYASFMESTLKEIEEYLNSKKVLKSSSPMVCFHNMDLENLDIEVGYHISCKIESVNDLKVNELSSQDVVTCFDLGSYEKQDETLMTMLDYINKNEYEMVDGIYYYYLNDPDRPETEYLIEMIIPVKKSN